VGAPDRTIADTRREIVRGLDDEITATKQHEPNPLVWVAMVKSQVEPEASGEESNGAVGVGGTDDDVVERDG
jgi:hypothetical protein